MTAEDISSQIQASDALYDRFVKSLEPGHRDEYVAVAADGRTLIAATLMEVADRAVDELGPGSFVFRIGERAVGRWR